MINKTLITILFFFSCLYQVFPQSSMDSLLAELSQTLENQNEYIDAKEHQIQQLKEMLKDSKGLSREKLFGIYDELFQAYRSYQFDSAFKYASKLQKVAYELEDKNRVAHAQLSLVFVLRSSGMYKETFDTLRAIQVNSLEDSLKVTYYEQYARAFYELSAYNGDEFFSPTQGKLGDQYLDSALIYSDPESLQDRLLKALKLDINGQDEEALEAYESITSKHDLTDHEYAMVAFSMSRLYLALGDMEKSKEMTIRSAIADLKSATKETVALMVLAERLFEEGELERAYAYINQAAKDAVFYGSRQRVLQVSAILPEIEAAKLASVEYEKNKLLIITISVVLFALMIIGFAGVIYWQFRQLKRARKKLADANTLLQELNDNLLESNKIKEEYIAYSFRKDSEYIAKVDRLVSAIDRKLMDRKFTDISQTLKSINLKKERETFYKDFDAIFLKLFPDFLSQFNSYFQPEDRYELKKDHSLPTELRIFALIRLGINDHEQIASILEYNVRTIYNYKNKVKSKSILSNEEFEKRVMEIKAF